MSVGRVRADLREAWALDPDDGDLRMFGRQLAEGTVTPEHAGVAVRALNAVPNKSRAELRAEIDARLTKDALEFAPPTTRTLAQHLVATIDPTHADELDEHADQLRELPVHLLCRICSCLPYGVSKVRERVGSPALRTHPASQRVVASELRSAARYSR